MEKLKTFFNDMSRYLGEVWIEVRPQKGRVAWPTLDTVKLSTKVVIASSLALGIFIGLLDIIFGRFLSMVVGAGKF